MVFRRIDNPETDLNINLDLASRCVHYEHLKRSFRIGHLFYYGVIGSTRHFGCFGMGSNPVGRKIKWGYGVIGSHPCLKSKCQQRRIGSNPIIPKTHLFIVSLLKFTKRTDKNHLFFFNLHKIGL